MTASEPTQAAGPHIESVEARAYSVPTDRPESDGTLEWDSTTIVVVIVRAAGVEGVGYTYTDASAAALIESKLGPVVRRASSMSPRACWCAMCDAARNVPRRGMAMLAISAVDAALWDLKARLLKLPLVALLGQVRQSVPIYGSGGFTSYSIDELQEQLAGWVEQGIARVKMKVGRHPAADPERVGEAREAIGRRAELFVDANGAYSASQAVRLSHVFAESGVCWFEEPLASDDGPGLCHVREHAPPGMDIAAGEYGDGEGAFLAMIQARAADVLQPDVTRCGGYTGLLRIAALCGAHHIPISLHCAPSLSMHAGCALREVRHIEYFHDHVRLEDLLFDGAPSPDQGVLTPDLNRLGHGLVFKEAEAARYRA